MARYDVLLADADGTLFDFLRGEKEAFFAAARKSGLAPDAELLEMYSAINAGHWKRLERGETTQKKLRVDRFADFLSAIGRSDIDAVAMSASFIEELGTQSFLTAGALEFCESVSRAMPIYLVTNGISSVQRSRFSRCAIRPYITDIIISEELGVAKPDPGMIYAALRMAGVADKRRAVMLGDSVSADIRAATAAGIDSILFTNGAPAPEEHGATHVADTLLEAEALLK